MTRIDEFWSFSYIISMNRLKNVYDVDFALNKGYIHSVDEEPDWKYCGAARFMWNNPHEVAMDSVKWDRCGILYADSSCFITITSPWSISCEGYGEIIPYDDQFKFMEWARWIKDEVDGQPVILSDEEDLVI